MTPSKVDIVLVVWNRPELTRATIDSIEKNTRPDNYNLIVIDNDSDIPTKEVLSEFSKNKVINELITNETNKGLEPARNQGLARVKEKYLVCVDNDLLCPPPNEKGDWVERMVKLMEIYPEYAALSMRTQVMIGTGNIFDGKEHQDTVEFPHPGGSYRIMNSQAVRHVGGWRDSVKSRGQEERYICGKLRDIGYKTGFAVQIKSLHLHGDKTTDGWGYPKDWKPEDSGHTDIWHPILISGDDLEQIYYFMETGEYE